MGSLDILVGLVVVANIAAIVCATVGSFRPSDLRKRR